jgi:HNH endonuclease
MAACRHGHHRRLSIEDMCMLSARALAKQQNELATTSAPLGALLSSGRRDTRRQFTPAERAAVTARQHHIRGVCKHDLPVVFHVHRVIPWISGGLTHIDNGMAACPDCHHRAPTLPFPDFVPWQWQDEGAPRILPILRCCGFATPAAASGAGKALFAESAVVQLVNTGRVVWFVPTRNVRRQVRTELAVVGV